jgi:hypothetical protein
MQIDFGRQFPAHEYIPDARALCTPGMEYFNLPGNSLLVPHSFIQAAANSRQRLAEFALVIHKVLPVFTITVGFCQLLGYINEAAMTAIPDIAQLKIANGARCGSRIGQLRFELLQLLLQPKFRSALFLQLPVEGVRPVTRMIQLFLELRTIPEQPFKLLLVLEIFMTAIDYL